MSRAPGELIPRLLRYGRAPAYLGMCRAEFDKIVRPHVSEVRIGKQGIAFDRLELDAWADQYIATNTIDKERPREEDRQRSERPGRKGGMKWGERRLAASTSAAESGTSTNRSSGMDDFAKALAKVRGREQSAT